MRKWSVVFGFVGFAMLALPASALAQDEEAAPPSLTDVWLVVPKAGMESEFFAAIAADKELRDKKNDSRSWEVYTVEMGDHTNVVQFRACCFDWGDEDAYRIEEEEKGFSKHWNEKVEPYIDHYHRQYQKLDYENSHWPDGKGDGPFYGVTTWKIKAGSGPASGAARKKMSQLALNEGWASDENNWLWHWSLAGKPTLMIASSFASYADMAPPEQSFNEFAVEKLGEEEAGELFADFNSGLGGSDYTIWVHQPELSAAPADE